MKRSRALAATAASTMLVLTGCIDNGYDLSDIDTTSEIKVDNLTIPVNLDPVVLSDIIKIENGDDDKVKEVTINGKTFYAVEETGTFDSDPVHIDPFSVEPDELHPTTAEFRLLSSNAARTRRRAGSTPLSYSLTSPVVKDLNYRADNIDKAIHSVTSVGFDRLTMAFIFHMNDIPGISSRELNGINLTLPKGLSLVPQAGQTYDPTSGTMTVQKLALDASGRGRLEIVANAIDMTANGVDIDYASHSFLLESHFTINAAKLDLALSDGTLPSQLPQTVGFDINYEISAFNAKTVSGTIEYDLEGDGLDISPIELNDLPDFLAQEKTNLILHNPQIYLELTNPLGNDHLYCETGLQLTAFRDGQSPKPFTLDNFRIGSDKGFGPYRFCLSPFNPADVPAEFSQGLQHVEFASLGHVLSGDGLPKSIGIDLLSPKVPVQKVKDFALGRELPRLEGSYRLLAPLALSGNAETGSVIYYTDRKDGWNDEDIDGLVISTMKLTTEVTSTLPIGAKLTAHPLDKEGHIINGVSVAGGNIQANAQNQPIELTITGAIEHLDGVEFTAEVRPDGSNTVLAPSQTITLSKIRVTVGGTYTKKF